MFEEVGVSGYITHQLNRLYNIIIASSHVYIFYIQCYV